MPRNSRRGQSQSTGAVLGSVLSIAFFIALGIGVVILKKQRRAARNDAQFGRTDDGGGNSGFNAPQGSQPQAPFVPNGPAPQPARRLPGLYDSTPEGGFFGKIDYREVREDRAILIGFEVGLTRAWETDIVAYLRPIWLTESGEEFGPAYGRKDQPVATVKARDGYAVGGIYRVNGGGALEGIAFTFMRQGPNGLITSDAYFSDYYGEVRRKPHADQMKAEAEYIVGIFGKRFEEKDGTKFDNGGAITSMGLVRWVKE